MRVVIRVALTAVLFILAAGSVAAGVNTADLSITKAATPNPVLPGSNITYTITVQNVGPQDATSVAWDDALPPGTTFVSLTGPAGWSLVTPAVGGTGTVTGTRLILTVADGAQVFTLVVQVDAGVKNGTLFDNIVNVDGSSIDPNPINNSFITIVTAGVPATPVPSVPNAAMPAPASTNPAIPLGIAVVLMAGLSMLAVLSRRRAEA
jgi:uncharacterized repeat protein (TIGR01451 family)